jgi:hypothetical protein
MRALLAITARELRERWTLLFAMFCSGVFVLLVPALRLDVRALPTAVLLMVPATWALAVLMGGSVIARDLADDRLGFFFARPVSWWAIAGGKLLAAVLLTLGAATAGVLPALVVDWSLPRYAREFWQLLMDGHIMLMLALLLALVGFGHVASVVYRSRSAWAAVDFLLLAASGTAAVLLFHAYERLGLVMSGPPSRWGLVLELLLIALVPLAATAAQVALGRSDMRRGHVALSVTFWCGVLVWFTAFGGLLVRELGVTPTSLAPRFVTASSPDGRLVGLLGRLQAPGRMAAFVLDTQSGHYLRQPVTRGAFSADGRHVAWVEEAPFWRDRVTEVQLARFDGREFAVESVELDGWLRPDGIVGLALSPQADRLAIIQNATLSVHEIPSGRSLSQSAAADGDWMAVSFLPDGQLRAFRRVRPALGPPGTGIVPGRVEVISMSGGVPSSAVRLEAVGHAILISPPDDAFVLLHEPLAPRRISLHDVSTGRRLRTFSGEDGYLVMDAYLLRNGRVALIEANGPAVRLRLSQEGQPDRLLELPEGAAFVGGEVPGGLLSVGRFLPKGAARLERETLFLSSDTGELRGRESGLLPVRGRLHPSQHFSGTAAQLFVTEAGELLQFDPSTRQRRVILPAAPVP